MSLHCNDTPKQGLLERLEASDPRDVTDETIAELARRVSCLARRFSGVSCGDERAMFGEMEYGAECVVDHFTPAEPSELDQHRHNQDVRRKMSYEEQAA